MSAHRRHLQLVADRLHRATPARRLTQAEHALDGLSQRLERTGIRRLETAQRRLGSAVRALHSVSPLQTLERGYAIARDAQGDVLRDASTVAVGETVAIDLARGRLDCEVRARHERAGLKEHNNRD